MLTDERNGHAERFYALLAQLADRVDGPRRLRSCTKHSGWPSHGVYFFYEPGELRADGSPRDVRVGTPAPREAHRATLWGRLLQHRSNRAGSGNRCSSTFRQHVVSALINRTGLSNLILDSWLNKHKKPTLPDEETRVEELVNVHIGLMPFAWLVVPTSSDGTSLRGRSKIDFDTEQTIPPSTRTGHHRIALARACGTMAEVDKGASSATARRDPVSVPARR